MTSNRQRVLAIGLIVIGLLIAGFFGLRSLRAFKEFRGHRPPPVPFSDAQPAETDVELIREWMTMGFVSYSYRLPPTLLYESLAIPPKGNERKSLRQLNDEYYPDQPGYVLESVKETIRAYQSTLPPVPLLTPTPSTPKP